MQTLRVKHPKSTRERLVLFGLIELYIKTGKPVGSNTLKENGFSYLSSATIRNYFARLEQEGFLFQQHPSGGRVPTQLGLKEYSNYCLKEYDLPEKIKKNLQQLSTGTTKETAAYLQYASELLSNITSCAVFLSAPRFDQDFVTKIKLMFIDKKRCICAIITDFGMVHSEIINVDDDSASDSIPQLEAYFQFRLSGLNKPILTEQEDKLAEWFYNEIMLRHIVKYSNFTSEDIYKTGFSKLLNYRDFIDNPTSLSGALSIFENKSQMSFLLQSSIMEGDVKCWIGGDLIGLSHSLANCTVIACPYRINRSIAGAIAILGPMTIPYKQIFSIMRKTSEYITQTLTSSLYKYKISFRNPQNYSALKFDDGKLLKNMLTIN